VTAVLRRPACFAGVAGVTGVDPVVFVNPSPLSVDPNADRDIGYISSV
jgi:hypothetical protein